MTVNVADLLRPLARSQGDSIALVSDEGEITFRELDLRVRKMATCLLDHGLRPGFRVGMLLRDNVGHVITLFAIWSIEAVAIPLDFRSPPAERRNLAAHFRVEWMIAPHPFGDLPCIVLDESWWRKADASKPLSPGTRDGTAQALVMTSSGTTGRPKGFQLSQTGLFHRLLTHQRGFGIEPGDRYLNLAPMYFTAGRNYVVGHLLFGATVILGPSLVSPQDIISLVEKHEANMLFTVPTLCRQLLDMAPASTPLLPQMKLLRVGGAAISDEEYLSFVERLTPNTKLVYASSVSGLISVLTTADLSKSASTAGRVTPFTDIEIVDDDRRPVGPGEFGRIRVRQPGMAESVCGLDDESEAREHLDSGWAYPGDLGMLDDGGILTLRGRYTDTIIRGGANIDPIEIENVIRQHPEVEDAAVVGVPSPALGQEVVAFVVTQGTLPADKLQSFCRRNLAAFKTPSDIVFVCVLPRNTAGKVVKQELVAAFVADGGTAISSRR